MPNAPSEQPTFGTLTRIMARLLRGYLNLARARYAAAVTDLAYRYLPSRYLRYAITGALLAAGILYGATMLYHPYVRGNVLAGAAIFPIAAAWTWTMAYTARLVYATATHDQQPHRDEEPPCSGR